MSTKEGASFMSTMHGSESSQTQKLMSWIFERTISWCRAHHFCLQLHTPELERRQFYIIEVLLSESSKQLTKSMVASDTKTASKTVKYS